jgi:hypothetical protein
MLAPVGKRTTWEQQREWLVDEIEKDAQSYRGPKSAGSMSVYFGRLDALFRVGLYFDFWDNETMMRMSNWLKAPEGRSLRQVLGEE